MTLHEKLLKMQEKLDYMRKDNTKNYQYNYVSGSMILAKMKLLKDEFRLLLYPVINHETSNIERGESVGKTKTGKLLYEYVFTASGFMIWEDEKGEKLQVPFFFTGSQNDPSKAFGSALTYSERYFLLKFFGIPTDEIDPDAFQEKTAEPLSDELVAVQNEVIIVLREMYSNKIAGFDNFETLQKSIKKHLNIKITDLKHLKTKLKKVLDEEKLDKYGSHLVTLMEEFEAKKNSAENIKELHDKINKGLELLAYQVTHRTNQILKHLGTVTVETCEDVEKLKEYYDYLSKEYKEKIRKEGKK